MRAGSAVSSASSPALVRTLWHVTQYLIEEGSLGGRGRPQATGSAGGR